jgi:hypothetical protein
MVYHASFNVITASYRVVSTVSPLFCYCKQILVIMAMMPEILLHAPMVSAGQAHEEIRPEEQQSCPSFVTLDILVQRS